MKHEKEIIKDFARDGIIVLRKYLAKPKVEKARLSLLDELKRLNLLNGGKWQTKSLDGINAFQISNRIGAKLRPSPEYGDLFPPDLEDFLQELAGEKISFLPTPPQLLVTPPQKEKWSLPAQGWHVDIAERNVLPGIQLFALLDELLPEGGATLALKGSHKNRELKPDKENVLEMHGSAGDVFFMDMRVLHCPAVNARPKARLMVTSRFMAKRD